MTWPIFGVPGNSRPTDSKHHDVGLTLLFEKHGGYFRGVPNSHKCPTVMVRAASGLSLYGLPSDPEIHRYHPDREEVLPCGLGDAGRTERQASGRSGGAGQSSALTSQSVVSAARMVGGRQSNPEVSPTAVGALRRWESLER